MIRYITDDLEISSDDSDKKHFDKESGKGLAEYQKNYSKILKQKALHKKRLTDFLR